ncbi:hypothetical protein PIB30_013159 [Stylosanthes scabra]|uniref:DNA ligase n=1 Tax=Stylosanthes scabra TaxID=79078 RepID=A0ABU6Y571_9FABA|nr:hypothetical protein [Stylosanthes scabra]
MSQERGTPVPFSLLASALDMISKESGTIATTDIACNLMQTVIYSTPEDLLPMMYLLRKKVAPAHEGVEIGIGDSSIVKALGIGDSSIVKALAEANGTSESEIKKLNKEEGDLGLVAKKCRSSQSKIRMPDPLTIRKVFDTFRLIAKGELRIGMADQTLLAALAQAAVYTEEHSKPPADIKSPVEEAVKIVKQAYSVFPVYDKIVSALLTHGVWKLPSTCNFTPGIPVGPMLSKRMKSFSEILNTVKDVEFTCEYKYDGQRAQLTLSCSNFLLEIHGKVLYIHICAITLTLLRQIHYMENGSVEIYSRNAKRNTGKYPDVVAAISR